MRTQSRIYQFTKKLERSGIYICGVFGFFSKSQKFDKRLNTAYPLLALFMESRGGHSWGISDGSEIIKDSGAISGALTPDLYAGKHTLIGHTRFATTGAHTKENAHPWSFEHEGNKIIGMHNGMISNHSELNKEHGRDFEVDSMHIFQHIVEGKDTSEIRGYGTVVFFRDGKLYLVRFNGGDLAVARTELGVMFASTESAVGKACKLSGINVETFYTIPEEELLFVEDGTLLTTKSKMKFGTRYGGFTTYQGPVRPYYNRHEDDYHRSSYANTSGTGTSSYNSNRGRYVNNAWESGQWIDGHFLKGSWRGDMFHPDSTALPGFLERLEADKREESNKEDKTVQITPKTRNKTESKVIIMPSQQAEEDCCVKCGVLFPVDADTWDSPVGEICDDCACLVFGVDTAELSEEDAVDNTEAVGDMETGDAQDSFKVTRASNFLTTVTQGGLIAPNISTEAGLISCDECPTQLKDDMKVYFAKLNNKPTDKLVTWIMCEKCYKELEGPAFQPLVN